MLKGVNLYLVGMMGAGKTSVGRELAQKLDYRFFDMDDLIERVMGQTVNEIFAGAGESAFRQLESQVLGELSAYTYSVIATGGGIILRQENWSYLHHGLIVWLDVPMNLLIARLTGDSTRPLLKDPNPELKLQALFSERQHLYAQADLRVTVRNEETPEQVAVRVMEEIPKVLKPPKQSNSNHS